MKVRAKGMLVGLLAVAAAAALSSGAMAASDAARSQPAVGPAQATSDIVDTAIAAGSFTTLATALEAAGLVDTLKGAGPFTVFAPTDAAFDALPAGALDALLADTAQLREVLLYHVVSGSVDAAAVSGMSSVTTMNGAGIAISVDGGTVSLNTGDATVTTADIAASNGIIHVIDAVLLPPAILAPSPGDTGNAGLVATDEGNGVLPWLAVAGVAIVLLGAARLLTARSGGDRA